MFKGLNKASCTDYTCEIQFQLDKKCGSSTVTLQIFFSSKGEAPKQFFSEKKRPIKCHVGKQKQKQKLQ